MKRKTPRSSKKFNLIQYYGKQAVATLHWNLPYAIIKFKKRIAEIDKKYPRGTYFIIEEVIDPLNREVTLIPLAYRL